MRLAPDSRLRVQRPCSDTPLPLIILEASAAPFTTSVLKWSMSSLKTVRETVLVPAREGSSMRPTTYAGTWARVGYGVQVQIRVMEETRTHEAVSRQRWICGKGWQQASESSKG